jgi:26S proteasome regulatory subunit N6
MVTVEARSEQGLLAAALEETGSEEGLRAKEQAIYDLAQLFIEGGRPERVLEFVQAHKHRLECFSKPKAAKILRVLIEKLDQVGGSEGLQIGMCEDLVRWCEAEKRTYLKHRVILKLANLRLKVGQPLQASQLIEPVVSEVRKADDKHLLVELNLLDSRIYFALQKYAKAKASLTSSRANANQVYCAPALMAEIDLHSGILYAQDRDFKTAYSYFFESFEGFHSIGDGARALPALKYMLLCKIMGRNQEDVAQLLASKNCMKYAGPALAAMEALSKASARKSVVEFKAVLTAHHDQIATDPVLSAHIQGLYEELVEQNLFLIIEPYRRVQLAFIAQKIVLDEAFVQNKLSEMILDKKIEGTLDQHDQCLIRYKEAKPDDLYKNGLKQLEVMNAVVDKINASVRAQRAGRH